MLFASIEMQIAARGSGTIPSLVFKKQQFGRTQPDNAGIHTKHGKHTSHLTVQIYFTEVQYMKLAMKGNKRIIPPNRYSASL